MSGGSFDYLYLKLEENPLDDYHLELLDDMVNYLKEQGKFEAAKEIDSFLLKLLKIKSDLTKLQSDMNIDDL